MDHLFKATDPSSSFSNQEEYHCGSPGSLFWFESITPTESMLTSTIDALFSVSTENLSADSPVSANKPLGSEEEEEEEDDAEIETKQTNDLNDIKRLRRMRSNRESARRLRLRKREQLGQLESQVERLIHKKSTLSKQLFYTDQHLQIADANNRFLRSDIETLRFKVKLAEDMVAKGSLTSSFNHLLLQSQPIDSLLHYSPHRAISVPWNHTFETDLKP